MGARELAACRIVFMLANYILGYIRYPTRILRTIGNVFLQKNAAATHRLKDMFRRKTA